MLPARTLRLAHSTMGAATARCTRTVLTRALLPPPPPVWALERSAAVDRAAPRGRQTRPTSTQTCPWRFWHWRDQRSRHRAIQAHLLCSRLHQCCRSTHDSPFTLVCICTPLSVHQRWRGPSHLHLLHHFGYFRDDHDCRTGRAARGDHSLSWRARDLALVL